MGSSEGQKHLHELDVDGRIILKLLFESWNGSELVGPVEPMRYIKSVVNPD